MHRKLQLGGLRDDPVNAPRVRQQATLCRGGFTPRALAWFPAGTTRVLFVAMLSCPLQT